MEINKHIVDNLHYYLSLSSPEYAFLLCGEWGVGKTHFIDEYIENLSEEKFKLIKISLFGLKNISDINGCIFQKLHPVLGSKYARLAGNVIKGALSMGVKLDINSDGASETTLNTKLEKLNISEFFSDKKSKEIVLIFDDLERSEISTVEVLGFINELVENSKLKVVLIANEKVLIEGSNGDVYRDFKEKVIGKTFEIKHDFSSILCDFLKGYSVSEYKDVIQSVYDQSKLKNLRKFKQSIDDFEYLIRNIDDKYKKNDQFYKDLVRCFFALSIEIKKGSLSEEELRKNIPFRKSTDIKKSSDDIYAKYFNDQAHVYDGDIWANILFKGDLDKINEETSKLALFVEKTEVEKPDWVKLWNFRELEDDEFSSLLERVEGELKSLTEDDLRIYLHKVALVIYFSKNNLSNISIDEVKEIVRKYIDKYQHSHFWKTKLVTGNSFSNGTGYGYFNDQDQDFLDLKSLIIGENERSFNEEILKKKEAEFAEIVTSIKLEQVDRFTDLLLHVYEYKPILHNIEPGLFVDALIQAKNATIVKVNDVICERYSENHYLNNQVKYSYLTEELEFWNGVRGELCQTLSSKAGLKIHLLELFLKYTVSKTINLLSSK
ncbi:P-loop NTPase fold protein [Photobacterium leiognathi]|uniref:P-loop NTPase fold protein n=1 Tax=Photobacterium leiognathi TaxID=553611 RepID=UPI00298292FE|nr:P-loop NTPase fold protein [Photobacterium leiognathi]